MKVWCPPVSPLGQFISRSPVFHVERRIGHDVIGLQVRMLILEERISRNFAQIGRQSSHRQVHLGQLVRRGRELLTVHRDVFGVAVM